MENWKNVMHIFVTVFLSYFASLIVNPTIADVTMEAVCPGEDECSLAIYLTGIQQAVAGLGSVFVMPFIGNLSDTYGRKLLLAIPLALAIIPTLTLAVKRTTQFFYLYYVLKTFTAMVTEGGVICLSLSYLADYVSEGKRVFVFGILSGVVSAANVCGTLTARLLSTARIFQVASVVAVVALVYMKVFLQEKEKEKPQEGEGEGEGANPSSALEEPFLKSSSSQQHVINKMSLPKAIIRLLRSSFTVSLASTVGFFNSLAEAGIQAFLMYYLKARFHFAKDQIADMLLITYIAATVSSMVVMPALGAFMSEETMLCIGLFAGFLNMLLDSIAWAAWVPYASALLGILLFLASPSIRCIISKQVGPYEQGIAHGCLMGIAAFANVISPLIYSPLSALFLSDDGAPFNYPGFSILCVGFAYLIAFMLSTLILIRPLLLKSNNTHHPSSFLA